MDKDGNLAKMQRFRKENPREYAWFLTHAKEYAQCKRRFSVKQLVEGYRWETRFRTPDRLFKFNNSDTAALARLLVQDAPEISDYITMRTAKCDHSSEHGEAPFSLLAYCDAAQLRHVIRRTETHDAYHVQASGRTWATTVAFMDAQDRTNTAVELQNCGIDCSYFNSAWELQELLFEVGE